MISKEEMRNARLRALTVNSPDTDTAKCNRAEQSPSVTADVIEHIEKRRHLPDDNSSPLSVDNLNAIKKLMYENGGATDEDILRWYSQGFQFCRTPSLGLRQGNGGPCGILAAVQAELLKFAIFGNSLKSIGVSSLPSLSVSDVERTFASACSSILARAAEGRSSNDRAICLLDCPGLVLSPFSPSTDIIVHYLSSESEATRFILERLDLFKSDVGCIVFLISLMLSRGLDRVTLDMDMESNTLIGPFGHCTQELLNLLLTGVASSNIMDGNVSMNGMVVKGVCQRSSVGYLTHLESLRYCQAGDFYKVPLFPVWVVGSTSHFTVLFALDRRVNEETESEKLLSLAQRAFKSADPEENGFILADKLKEVLEVLKYDEISNNEVELARLRGHLQIDGGIILWSSFWENVSRLISKQTTLDALINVTVGATGALLIDGVPLGVGQRERSDSDLAREMQAEMDGSLLMDLNNPEGNSFEFESATPGGRMRSDSEVAREMQAKWNSEEFSGPTVVPPLVPSESMDTFPSVSSPLVSAVKAYSSGSSAPFSPAIRSHLHRHDSFADEHAVSHLLYHFNGLEGSGRPARLTSLKLMPRSSENAIGVSMAMGGQSDNMSGGYCHPMEEVLRTRWPGCRIDWMGQPLPNID